MISAATIAEIEARGWLYILGVRMRRTKEANEEVLTRAGRYQEVYPKSEQAKAPSPLAVKEVWVDERRYIVCRNEDQATKDATTGRPSWRPCAGPQARGQVAHRQQRLPPLRQPAAASAGVSTRTR